MSRRSVALVTPGTLKKFKPDAPTPPLTEKVSSRWRSAVSASPPSGVARCCAVSGCRAAKVGARSSERTAIGDPARMSELVQFLLATLASALSSRLRLLLTTSTSELSDPDLTLASLQRPAVAYPPLRHLADRHPAGDRSADYVVVGAAFLEARRPASPPAFANLLDATISLGFAHSTALAPLVRRCQASGAVRGPARAR